FASWLWRAERRGSTAMGSHSIMLRERVQRPSARHRRCHRHDTPPAGRSATVRTSVSLVLAKPRAFPRNVPDPTRTAKQRGDRPVRHAESPPCKPFSTQISANRRSGGDVYSDRSWSGTWRGCAKADNQVQFFKQAIWIDDVKGDGQGPMTFSETALKS